MNELASHIIGVANREKIGVTNLHLQLTLYFTLIYSMANETLSKEDFEKIYNEPFIRSDYGPRVPSIYNEYKRFNSSNIIIEGNTNALFDDLNNVIVDMLNHRTSNLLERSLRHEATILELGGIEFYNYSVNHLELFVKFPKFL